MPQKICTPYAEEIFYPNTPGPERDCSGIHLQTFCHSKLKEKWTNRKGSRDCVMCSLILKGNNIFRNREGRIIERKEHFFKVSNLLHPAGNVRLGGTMERYYILADATPQMLHLVSDLFHEDLSGFTACAPEKLKAIFESIRDELATETPDQPRLGGLFMQLLLEASSQRPRSPLPDSLNKALAFINRDLADSSLDRQKIADHASISVSLLGKLFREYLNTTAGSYITLRRMEKSCHLLALSSLSITEIAEQCGFRYEYYFAREFKRRFGITPRQYRLKKDHRGNFP